MFSKIHNSPKDQKRRLTAGLGAFMGAFTIAVVAGSAPAYADCKQHVYNHTSNFWHMRIYNQPTINTVADHDIPPGGSLAYLIVTDGMQRLMELNKMPTPGNAGTGPIWRAVTNGATCSIDKGDLDSDGRLGAAGCVKWNYTTDGDIDGGVSIYRKCS